MKNNKMMHRNNYHQNNTIHEDILNVVQQHPNTSLDSMRERVLNNPTSFSNPPYYPEIVHIQNDELLRKFQEMADKLVLTNSIF